MNKEFKPIMFSKRLRRLRMDRDLTQDDIAVYVGVTRVAVSHWETVNPEQARYPSTRYIKRLAYILQVDEIYLMYGSRYEKYNILKGDGILGEFRKMPLVSFEYLQEQECDMNSVKLVRDYVIAKADNSECFCLVVDDSSMTSQKGGKTFYRGCRISVDPLREPRPGNYVIAKVGDSPYFRELCETNGTKWLKPLNKDYKDIKVFNEIMGVVYEHTMTV